MDFGRKNNFAKVGSGERMGRVAKVAVELRCTATTRATRLMLATIAAVVDLKNWQGGALEKTDICPNKGVGADTVLAVGALRDYAQGPVQLNSPRSAA